MKVIHEKETDVHEQSLFLCPLLSPFPASTSYGKNVENVPSLFLK